jgi:hypothetical protein
MGLRRFAYAIVFAAAAGAGLAAGAGQPDRPSGTPGLRILVADDASEAERLRERVVQGADFSALARAESSDPTAADGGRIGSIPIARLRPELRDALRGVGPGELTAIVRIPTGFAFLMVDQEGAAAGPPPDRARLEALLATGSVKYVLDVGGLPEAEAVLRDYPKPPGWDMSPQSICRARTASLAAGRKIFDDFFSPAMEAVRRSRPAFELMQARLGIAQLLAYEGDMEQALPHYQAAYQLARDGVPAAALTLEETLGLAYLQKASMDSELFRSPGDVCLIPPSPGQALAKPALASKAVEHFLRYLDEKPDELEVRWLLNLTYMLIGQYPDGVPARYLIPPSSFASTDTAVRFTDVAPEAGLNVFSTAGGVIVDDLAGSGRFDVVTSNFYSCGPMHYFGNNGDGTFTDSTKAAGLADELGGLNLVQTDYDNDGCTDMLVLRGGWEVPQRSSLLKNSCHGTFTDVTAPSGLGQEAASTQTAAWTDIDNDGWLDLFVGNENRPSQLFLNKGGRFEDISHAAGIDRLSFAKGVTAGDYDNDGFQDLYVSNFDGDNILYRNNHDRTFTDTTSEAGVGGPGRGFGTWFFDYDNDGWIDLFATSYFMSADETARTYLGLPHNAPTLMLYRNLGDGTFRDVTQQVGLDKVFMPMGANFGDLDNDGFLDIYLGMGTPSFGSIAPHVLLRNQEGRSFADVTAASGTGELHKGHGIAFVDLDSDGDEDIVAEIGGATPGDSHAMRLFENPGQGNDWIALKLSGARSNRAAIGTRITVTVANGGDKPRAIHRTVGSGGSFGASPLEQHIGLGPSARIVDVEIWWPASGTRQHFSDLAVNRIFAITENASTPTPVLRPAVRLGGDERMP